MISNKDSKRIRMAMILEAIGRPPEHLIETLEKIIKDMEQEKGVEVVEKKVHEPVEMKNQKDFYTSFAELEVEVEDILYLAILMFKYMPAHIEVISPETIALTNTGWNDIFNELIRRLHGYDEVAAVLQMEKNILENKLREVLKQTRPGDAELREVLGQEPAVREETSKEENKKVKKEKKKGKKK